MENVLLDNDFVSRIMRVTCANPVDVFTNMFNDLQLKPYIHQYIYENEIYECYHETLKELINKDTVRVLKYDDIFELIGFSGELYDGYMKDLYYSFHMEPFPENKPLRERFAGRSMGEMHSLISASFLGWNLFFSNDRDSKYIVTEQINIGDNMICVYNIEEVLDMLSSNSGISRNIKRALKAKDFSQ